MVLSQPIFKVIPTQQWARSLAFYQKLGYKLLRHQLLQGYSLLSNGQSHLMLSNRGSVQASFISYTNDLAQTVAYLTQKKIPFIPKNELEILVTVTREATLLFSNQDKYNLQLPDIQKDIIGHFLEYSFVTTNL